MYKQTDRRLAYISFSSFAFSMLIGLNLFWRDNFISLILVRNNLCLGTSIKTAYTGQFSLHISNEHALFWFFGLKDLFHMFLYYHFLSVGTG